MTSSLPKQHAATGISRRYEHDETIASFSSRQLTAKTKETAANLWTTITV
jgi:hypothetical protein